MVELETHRSALVGHCYRMLGSVADADDAVQETMVRAWRKMDGFDGRSTLRTWLYRIATNVCLDALQDRSRRFRPMEEGPAETGVGTLTKKAREHWLEPIADAKAIPAGDDPSKQAILRQSIRLAFVAALQHLPPKQRAVLLLTEVLDCSAAEVAECLEMSVAAVNSALQRARATVAGLEKQQHEPLPAAKSQLLEQYVEAFEAYDVERLVSLLRDDATFSMPPYALWLQGPEPVRRWLLGTGKGCRGSRLLPVAACGSPAFAQYRAKPEGGHTPFALVVLELDGERIAGWNSFLDTEKLFPHFGLPMELPAR